MFAFVDLDHTKTVDIKEFLVALTIGYVLDTIPALRKTEYHTEESPEIKKSISGFLGKQVAVSEILSIIVSAYLLFDPKNEGFIRKSTVERLLEENGHKEGNGSHFCSSEIWEKMASGLSSYLMLENLTYLFIFFI